MVCMFDRDRVCKARVDCMWCVCLIEIVSARQELTVCGVYV